MLRVWLAVGAMLGLGLTGGCVSPEQREADNEKAAVKAAVEAQNAEYSDAVKRGVPEVEAKKLSEEAYRVTYNATLKVLKSAPSSGGLGQVLSSILYVLVNVGLPLLGRREA